MEIKDTPCALRDTQMGRQTDTHLQCDLCCDRYSPLKPVRGAPTPLWAAVGVLILS